MAIRVFGVLLCACALYLVFGPARGMYFQDGSLFWTGIAAAMIPLLFAAIGLTLALKKPQDPSAKLKLNFLSTVLFAVTLLCGLGFIGSPELNFAPGMRIAFAGVGVAAAIIGGTLGTIAQRR